MADDSPRRETTYTPGTLAAPAAQAEDAWAGEDDPWLEAQGEDEDESPLGAFRAIVIAAVFGALVWTLAGLALYRLVIG